MFLSAFTANTSSTTALQFIVKNRQMNGIKKRGRLQTVELQSEKPILYIIIDNL